MATTLRLGFIAQFKLLGTCGVYGNCCSRLLNHSAVAITNGIFSKHLVLMKISAYSTPVTSIAGSKPCTAALHTCHSLGATDSPDKGHFQKKKQAKPKSVKQLKLRSKITDHDLAIKLKHVNEWLRNEHEVLVSLENNDPSNAKKMKMVFETVIDASKDLATVKQSEQTEQMLRFYLKPRLAEGDKHKVPDLFTVEELKKSQPK